MHFNPATLPRDQRGSRRVVGGKCKKCQADLPDIPTDKNDTWLWVFCPKCGEFMGVPEAVKTGGRVVDE